MPGAVSSGGGGISALYIIGFCLAGAVFLTLAIWLGIHLYRKRAAKKRQDGMGSAFLSVRGLVKDGEQYSEKAAPSTSFSRNNINSQIILPSRTVAKNPEEINPAERDQIIAYHRQSNNFPKPFSFALAGPNHTSGAERERLSVASSFAASSRFSVFSAASSYNESLASMDSKGNMGRSVRKVRQTFNPILPDEFVVIVGEQLMILQSFDDGWCVVGREGVPKPKTLFGASRSSRVLTPTSSNNVELGMVPAWCFLKQVKGLRAERPVRSTSLGVTVQMEGQGRDAEAQRNDTISWSNF